MSICVPTNGDLVSLFVLDKAWCTIEVVASLLLRKCQLLNSGNNSYRCHHFLLILILSTNGGS